MRVLVITPWFPSDTKPGAATFMLRDAELLNTLHEVTVIHLIGSADLGKESKLHAVTESGVTVIRHRFDPLDLASLFRARATIRKHLREADIVHSMALHALLPVRLARPTIPWVHTEHWSGLMQTSLPLKKRLGRHLYRSSLSKPNAVVAVGQALAESMRPFTNADIQVIPNHVVLRSHRYLPEQPESRGQAPLRLIAVGNLIDHKGPIHAINALKELQRLGVPATLTWVGTGPLRTRIIERARLLGLSHMVSLPGQVEPARIPSLLTQAHIFVLPTASETFGVAFAEALAQGLPIVATGQGEHLSFLPSGASIVADERSGAGIAKAIIALISNERRWTPQQIISYAENQFSEEKRKSAYAAVYSGLQASK